MKSNRFLLLTLLLLVAGSASGSAVTPPVDIQVSKIPVWIFMIANLVAASIAFLWMIMYSTRHRDAIPVWCFVGGFLAMFATEPALDYLLHVWYPTNTPWILAEFYGVSMPLYLFIGYPWYVGLGAFGCYKMLERKSGPETLWKAFWIAAILDVIIELPSTAAGVHIYYGNQPNFFKHGLSIQIPFVMPAIVLSCGMLLHALLSRLPDELKGPCAMLFIPICSVGTLVGASWPLMLSLNSGASSLIIWLTAFVSIAFCLGIVHIGLKYFSVKSADEFDVLNASDMGLSESR